MKCKPKVCVVVASGSLFERNILMTGSLDILASHCEVIFVGANTGAMSNTTANAQINLAAKIPIDRRRAKLRHFCRYLSMWRYRDRSSTFTWKFMAETPRRQNWLSRIIVALGLAKLTIFLIELFLKGKNELRIVLDGFKPDLVIIFTTNSDVLTADVIKACRKCGIQSMSIINGWDNPSSHGVWPVRPDRVGVWGDQMRKQVIQIQQMAPEAIDILGVPQFSYYYTPSSDNILSEMRQSLGVSEHEKVILFAGASLQFEEVPLLLKLDEAIYGGELELDKVIYRPHPWRKPRNEPNFFEQKWRHVILDPQMDDAMHTHLSGQSVKPHSFLPSLVYARDLLNLVDAVVCPLSTFMVESALMAKPILVIATQEGGYISPSNHASAEHFRGLSTQAGFRFCYDSSNLIADLSDLLTMQESEKSVIKTEIKRIIYSDDSSYSQRLWGTVKLLLPKQ